jgi:predicted acylesterase/phospholipase RssA
MKALVLSGGGARGAFEAGAIQSLRACGPFDIVCGTSAGAINASFVAQDAYVDLATTWATIASRNPIQLIPQVQHIENLVNDVDAASHDAVLRKVGDLLRALAEWMEIGSKKALLGLLGALSPAPITAILQQHVRYSDLAHTLIVTATNVTTQTADTYFFFPPNSGVANTFAAKIKPGTNRYPITATNYVSVVQASGSIPGAFPPVPLTVNGMECQYVDGGVANNTPIGQAIDAGADEVYIVFMDPAGATPAPQTVSNLFELGMACIFVMQSKILEDDMKLALTVNEAIAARVAAGPALTNKRQVKIWEVRPKAPLPITVLQFDQQPLLDQAYQLGKVAGQTPLQATL